VISGTISSAGDAVSKTADGLKKGVGDTLNGLTNPLQPKK
jgi:hypothetical protein